jgi:hypothetical protein
MLPPGISQSLACAAAGGADIAANAGALPNMESAMRQDKMNLITLSK